MPKEIQYSEKMQKLFELVAELTDLSHISAVLGWDQQVNLPAGGTEERALQSAALGRIMHEKVCNR